MSDNSGRIEAADSNHLNSNIVVLCSAVTDRKMPHNKSLSMLQDCVNSDNWLEKTLQLVEHFPPVPVYGGMNGHLIIQIYNFKY